jgi:hypothetical protein
MKWLALAAAAVVSAWAVNAEAVTYVVNLSIPVMLHGVTTFSRGYGTGGATFPDVVLNPGDALDLEVAYANPVPGDYEVAVINFNLDRQGGSPDMTQRFNYPYLSAGLPTLDPAQAPNGGFELFATSGPTYFGGPAFDPTLTINSVDFVLGAVPEPSTWAFMLIGFGLVGGGLRQRRQRESRTPLVAKTESF